MIMTDHVYVVKPMGHGSCMMGQKWVCFCMCHWVMGVICDPLPVLVSKSTMIDVKHIVRSGPFNRQVPFLSPNQRLQSNEG